MENTVFSDSSTSAAQKRIFNTLKFSLKKKYGIEDDKVVSKILSVQGLDASNMDVIANVERCITSGLIEDSLDQNSNKSGLTTGGLINESATVPFSKIIGFRFLYRKLAALFGKGEAKRLTGEMYDYSLAINDSGQLLKNYCYSYDLSKIVMEGRPYNQLHSNPPKRVSSYIACVNETVHQLSNETAGAVACSSLFLDIAHILFYREKVSLFKIKHSGKVRKYLENCLQTFVHSVNHLSRSTNESPFSNISILDRTKLDGLIAKENMGWYFNEVPKWFLGSKEKWFEYVKDGVIEIQKIFINFFDKGDPAGGGRPYRFPVCTLNITKDENGEVIDKDFVDYISSKEIFRYNIMVSTAGRFANCCRLISDSDMFDMGGQVSSLGMSQISLGSHRVVNVDYNRAAIEAIVETKNSILLNDMEEAYFKIIEQRLEDSAKILKAHKELLADLEKQGYQQFITNGYIKFERLFSTFGITGIIEGCRNLSKHSIEKKDESYYLEKTLVLINQRAKDLGKKYSININIEIIPGESLNVKLRDVTQIIFDNMKQEEKFGEISDYPLYSNQWVELWKDCSIWERMDKDGKINKFLTGGGIVHFTLKDKPTQKQVKVLLAYAIKSGCEHFALNAIYSECSEGHTTFGNSDICPICKANIIEKYERVVGFFTNVGISKSSTGGWNKVRREFDFPNRIENNIDIKEEIVQSIAI